MPALHRSRWFLPAAGLILAAGAGTSSLAAGDVYPGPTPRAQCGPGSNPEPGRQGRMTAADAAKAPFTCNTQLLGHFGAKGGYKVERYVDRSGHDCAYYDTTLLFPKDAVVANQDLTGVYALDMSDPSHPVRTATLSTPAMQSPHESLLLNQKRGLLVAVTGNPAFAPGFVDVYDVTADCRHPALASSIPAGLLGHESGMPPDGLTYYASSLDAKTITAVDLTNPAVTHPLWVGSFGAMHGLSVSDDGNRAYLATRAGLVILDVSQVQARVPNPQVTQVGTTLSWPTLSTPQTTIPVTINGHKYLIEDDEFGSGAKIGAGRIIDIADDLHPKVISNFKLEVNMPENQADQVNDPGSHTQFRGYEAHYCEVPQRQDPHVVACTFILSGLRLFDIRDPYTPKEIAYFNAVPQQSNPGSPTAVDPASNFAMSRAAFVPERNEIWYTDGNSGFYSLRLTNGVGALVPGSPATGPVSANAATGTGAAGGNPAASAQLGTPNTSASAGRPAIVWLALAVGLGMGTAVTLGRRRRRRG